MDKNETVELVNFLAEFTHDPLKFVYAAFPWGEGELKDMDGPEKWQADLLADIRDKLKTPSEVIREAVASGHGIGKSALVAWLILWAISTFEDTRGVVTANTATQLGTKTWPELIKWYQRFIGKPLFTITATAIFSTEADHQKTWRIDAIPWSDTNTEAFAGLHNQGKRIIVIFDEASAISNQIWEVAEGAMTDDNTEIIWCAFGNPTRNTGRFFDCFHRQRQYWYTQQIDSRTVRFSNKKTIKQWIEEWGLESDFVKVRVLGQFPNSSENQFISTELATAGRGKHLNEAQYKFAPVIICCDPAWSGGDATAIIMRQGLACSLLANFPRNDNDFVIAQTLAQFEDRYKADAVIIDLGYGTGIYSAGKTMGRSWMLVSFAEKSPDPDCLNMRAYIWKEMREWLKQGGAYPDDQQFYDDLVGPETKPRADGVIQLESKADMKKRGLPSPNKGDALALSFSRHVTKKDTWSVPNKNGLYFANNNQRYTPGYNLRKKYGR
ncbi:terminase [Pectinatus frisingensis]|uniref:terminase n=1 Tax=Pectinatus frisingensis TaxID=865 RepID=UPI0018C4A0E6|nr:terminase [Pectinatus frisingensis]